MEERRREAAVALAAVAFATFDGGDISLETVTRFSFPPSVLFFCFFFALCGEEKSGKYPPAAKEKKREEKQGRKERKSNE